MPARRSSQTPQILGAVSNDGDTAIAASRPYIVRVDLQGTSDLLFHRYSCDSVAAKTAAPKGSAAKKTDDLESYVYRTDDGLLAIPGEWLRGSIVNAARFRQDPRSTRKTAMDLFKAGVVILTDVASLGIKDWDYLDRRRVAVGRVGVSRERPAIRKGWRVSHDVMINLPEYIEAETLISVINDAGRLCGIGDFRPTFGRFAVVGFNQIE